MKYLAFVVALSCLLGGCASPRVVNYVSGANAQKDRGLGRVAVLVRFHLSGDPKQIQEKERITAKLVNEVFASVPEAVVTDSADMEKALGARRPFDAGDAELAEAARHCGLDAVALVTVERFGGEFTVSLAPPYWSSRGDYRYRLRLVDADTAELLMDADRGRDETSYFAARGLPELSAAFKRDLADLLDAPLALNRKS